MHESVDGKNVKGSTIYYTNQTKNPAGLKRWVVDGFALVSQQSTCNPSDGIKIPRYMPRSQIIWQILCYYTITWLKLNWKRRGAVV
jgi:hypothetical protein